MRTMYQTSEVYIYEYEKRDRPRMERWMDCFLDIRHLVEQMKERIIADYKPKKTKRITVSFLKENSRLAVSFWDDEGIIVSVSVKITKELKLDNDDISLFDDIIDNVF